jgi:hypothetical protein
MNKPSTSGLADWVQQASREPVLFLPHSQPHAAGGLIGLASFVIGLFAAQASFVGHQQLAWVALGGVLVGMVLHWRWKTAGAGWRVHFDERRVEPVGVRGDAQTLGSSGWSIQIAPGGQRSNVAIDLRHDSRGRVARLLDVPARGKADTVNLDQLADRLAQRLGVPRTGLRL